MSLVIYSDGGSRGNPGKSAYAIVVTKDGEIIHEHYYIFTLITLFVIFNKVKR